MDMTCPVKIPAGSVVLEGDLNLPKKLPRKLPRESHGVVLFVHGSGSSRYSPRNRYVAQVLNQAGFATLLMDLFTAEEEAIDQRTRHLRFDLPLLADRLVDATQWLAQSPDTRSLPLGYFGATMGSGPDLADCWRP